MRVKAVQVFLSQWLLQQEASDENLQRQRLVLVRGTPVLGLVAGDDRLGLVVGLLRRAGPSRECSGEAVSGRGYLGRGFRDRSGLVGADFREDVQVVAVVRSYDCEVPSVGGGNGRDLEPLGCGHH